MTFELSSEQQALEARAVELAASHVAPVAETIDAEAAIPDAVATACRQAALLGADTTLVDAIVVIEAVARTSASVAAALGLAFAAGQGDTPLLTAGGRADSVGLRGLGASDEVLAGARGRVVVAAVAVGVARAAIDEALAVMRASGDRPNGSADERPHWALADAATEAEAAWLLTSGAAQALDSGAGEADASQAKAFASDAAVHAVDSAMRMVGPDGYRRGTRLERLERDARTLALTGGTADEQRAIFANLTFHG